MHNLSRPQIPHPGLQNPGKVYFLDGNPSLAGPSRFCSVGPSLPRGSRQHLWKAALPPQSLGLGVEGLESSGL